MSEQLTYKWKFPYRHVSGGGMPAPLVPVRLRLEDYEVDFLALLDTGAEQTLLDGVHLRAAGVDIFAGEQKRFQGFLGASTVAYQHPSTVVIETLELDLPIAYSTFPIGRRQVIGRDLMAHLGVGVRERYLEFWLTPDVVERRRASAIYKVAKMTADRLAKREPGYRSKSGSR